MANDTDISVSDQLAGSDGSLLELVMRNRRYSITCASGAACLWADFISEGFEACEPPGAVLGREDRFYAMAEQAPVIIWVADQGGGGIMFNRLWTETTGQLEADALGTGWLAAVHPLDRDRVMGSFYNASEKREPARTEYSEVVPSC